MNLCCIEPMTDRKKQSGPREFKAVWAADEEWKTNRSKSSEQEPGWALRQFNKIGAKFEKIGSRREEEPLPWIERVKRLPLCALRSSPLVVSLIFTYWVIAFVIVWLTSGEVQFMKSSNHWFEVSYMTAVLAILVGYREARYPEGIFKPSLKHLFRYIRSDWVFLLPAIGFISFIGLESGAESDPIALQIFMIGALVLAVFWATDLVAYKTANGDEEK